MNLQLMHKALNYCNTSAPHLSVLNSQWSLVVTSTVVLTIFAFGLYSNSKQPRAPIVGYRSLLEPTFVLRARFFLGAGKIVTDGYSKVEQLVLSKMNTLLMFSSSKMACSGYDVMTLTFWSYRQNMWTSSASCPNRRLARFRRISELVIAALNLSDLSPFMLYRLDS